ncbi:MAG: hypothetical protein GC162_01125 [Planctomycetes bacterium]|nr:hypothetical protein [Planctomycetota bacterium]
MSQPHPADSDNRLSIAIFLIPLVIANLILLMMAWQDRSFGALAIAIAIGPITNGVMLLLGLVGIPFVKAAAKGRSITDYLTWSIAAPVGAVMLDFFIIFNMGLHGC